MSGLTVLRREDQTVSVALEDRSLKPGLSDLRWRLPRLVGSGADTLVIDLSGVGRLSSASIATLLFAKRTCAARRVRVVLSSPSPRALEQLTRTGLTNVLEIERKLP
jgi:anti-anti-sigma factor